VAAAEAKYREATNAGEANPLGVNENLASSVASPLYVSRIKAAAAWLAAWR